MTDQPGSVPTTEPTTEVFVEWEGRRHPLGRVVRRRRRLSKLLKPGKKRRAPDVPDIPDLGCTGGPDSLDEFAALLAIVAVVFLLVLHGPAMLTLLVEAILVVVLTMVVVVVAAGRTLFRRPWRVVAARGWDELWVWHQVGFRDARRLAAEIEASLSAGLDPRSIAADRLDARSPLALHEVKRSALDHPFVRWGSRLLIVVTAVGIIAASVMAVL